MSDIDNDLLLESLQMGLEAAQAQLMTINAQNRAIMARLEMTEDDAALSEHEQEVRNHLMKSVSRRVVNMIRLAAERAGEPTDDATLGDLLTAIAREGFGPNVNVKVDTNAAEDGIKIHPPAGTVTYGQERMELAGIQAGDDNEDQFSDPDLAEDEVPVFSSSRTPNHATASGIIMGQVFEGFAANELDVNDVEIRDKVKADITDYYLELADNLHDNGVFVGQQYDALVTSLRDGIYTDEIQDMLPSPGPICDTICEQAKQGPEFRVMISSGEEAMEAILTANSISNVRYESEVAKALLPQRLADIGISGRS